MKNVFLLCMTILLSACGTTGPLDLSKLNKPIPAGKSRIVVTRDSSLLYLAAAVDVRSNGVKIASLGRGGSVVHDILQGQNTLSVSTPTAPGQFTVTFNAQSKQIYNFEISPRGSNVAGAYGFGLIGDSINASVSEQSGYFKIAPK